MSWIDDEDLNVDGWVLGLDCTLSVTGIRPLHKAGWRPERGLDGGKYHGVFFLVVITTRRMRDTMDEGGGVGHGLQRRIND